jgi:hypothetical protein
LPNEASDKNFTVGLNIKPESTQTFVQSRVVTFSNPTYGVVVEPSPNVKVTLEVGFCEQFDIVEKVLRAIITYH